MTENKDIQIRLAEREDAREISVLLKKLGLNLPNEIEKINQHWDRLWKNNPYYSYFNEKTLYGWVMLHNNNIVGFFGCIPRIYFLNSKPIPVAIASQWGVEKEYRTYTGLLCDKFFNENPIALKLVTTAIKPTGKIFEKYGGHKVPVAELDKVIMIPINLFKLIIHKYNKSIKKYLFKFLNYLIPWKLQFQLINKNKNISEIDFFSLPSDINEFFERYFKNVKGLVAYRSSDILKWYYSGGNRELTKKIFVYSLNNKTLGYASIINEPIKDNLELKRYKIIDLIAENTQIKKEMIKELIRISNETKIDILEIHHAGTISKDEIPAFALNREYSQFPLYYQTTDNLVDNLLKDKNNWNISPFDGDTCLGL